METVDNILNLNYLGKSNISLSKSILLFYLIIANNHTKELFSGQFTQFVQDNRVAQHLIGFLTMVVLLNMVGGVYDTKKNVIYSLLAYTWFTLTTKLDLHWNLLIIALLSFGLFYENTLMDKEIKSLDDESLEEKHLQKIKTRHDKLKTGIAISIMLVTFVGAFTYYNRKQVQYGGGFDPVKFLLSRPSKYLEN
jgi:hypothetical protein